MDEKRKVAPRWQRARVLKYDGNPDLVGRTLWVEGAPASHFGYSVAKGDPFGYRGKAYLTALIHDGARLFMPSECLELLPDFTHAAPTIPYETWLAQPQRRDTENE